MDLKEIFKPISEELSQVEREIQNQLAMIGTNHGSGKTMFINGIVSHLFDVPGKRLRPALVLLSAKSVNNIEKPDTEQFVKMATAIELIHSASLIHDDIIDKSKYRRHRLTLNKKYGNHIAVLVGDILYSQFISLLISLKTDNIEQQERLGKILCSITKNMCFGEIYEYKIKKDRNNPSLDEYLEVIENKTASLFSGSCQVGGIVNGADEEIITALANFGLYFGLSFQIADDCMDGDSIFSSRASLIDTAREYADKAKGELKVLKEDTIKKTFFDLCDYVLERVK